jgi:hypothetical protein
MILKETPQKNAEKLEIIGGRVTDAPENPRERS